MTVNLRLSRARTGVVAMRQASSYYNNWIPRNWGEKGVKIQQQKNTKINTWVTYTGAHTVCDDLCCQYPVSPFSPLFCL